MSKKATAAAPTAAAESATTELVIPSKEALLAPIAAAREEIEKAVEEGKGLTIAGHVDGPKAGYAVVSAHRKKLKNLRTTVEKARTASKAPVLELERAIDSLARGLTALIVPEEYRLQADEKAYEAEVEAERQRKARAAADQLRARIQQLKDMGATLLEIDADVAQKATEEEWTAEVERVRLAIEKRRTLADRTDALRAVGAQVPFGLEDWTEQEFCELLDRAVSDKEERDRHVEEEARQREQDARDREALRRSELLSALGVEKTREECASMSLDEFSGIAAKAREARRLADEDAARLRREAEEQARPKAASAPVRVNHVAAPVAKVVTESASSSSEEAERDALNAWREKFLIVIKNAPHVEELAGTRDYVIAAVEAALEPINFYPAVAGALEF